MAGCFLRYEEKDSHTVRDHREKVLQGFKRPLRKEKIWKRDYLHQSR